MAKSRRHRPREQGTLEATLLPFVLTFPVLQKESHSKSQYLFPRAIRRTFVLGFDSVELIGKSYEAGFPI
jgi:hypothetical protein